MWEILVAAAILVCAIQAIRVKRLLSSALWLAGSSALVAILLYLLGAAEIAVIELSVGAGLVTVLFVFAINITGDETQSLRPVMPKWLAWILILTAVGLIGWQVIPGLKLPSMESTELPFTVLLWVDRKLDVLLQVVLIFAGVLGVLGLLSEGKPHEEKENPS